MMRRVRMIAACVTVAFCPAAQAVVVVTVLPEPLVIREHFGGRHDPIDVDGNGTVDFTFGSDYEFVGLRTERSNRAIIQTTPPPDVGGPLQPLSPGYMIGSIPGPANGIETAWISSNPRDGYVEPGELWFISISLVVSTGSASAFPEWGLRAPVGIEFEAEDGIHYGYLDIRAGKGYAGITLYGWAWETEPGKPIVAGLVPEPSSALLAGMGLAFMLAGRGRRIRRA